MTQCAKSNCKKPANPKGDPPTLCADHQRLKKLEDEKQARQKKQEEDKLKATEEARKAAAVLQAKKQVDADEKKKEVAKLATAWNTQVKKVVAQVLALRKANPTVKGINAGKNGGLGTIEGGTDNPISFKLPSSNPYKITKAEVFQTMSGFDSSDSGTYKFRVGDVLVHGD